MPRLLALEWDAAEARVLVGATSGASVSVEQAFIIPLAGGADGAALTPLEIGQRIGAALIQRGIAKGDALVCVGRSNIELRLITVPPAPPDELPEMVRMQAIRQFSTLGDDWPVDYVPLDASEEKEQNVLAATISPELIEQLRQTCTAAGLTMKRLMLRPFAAAATVMHDAVAARCGMLVDLLAEEADLTVIADGQAIFPRTVRLPATDEETVVGRSMAGEIRRTMVAAANQLAGRRVEEIVLLGRPDDHPGVRQKLADELELPVRVFDAFDTVERTGEVAARLPRQTGRFAPLVGMLREDVARERQGIDFLHPRQRPEPPDLRRRNILIGSTAAAVLLAVFLLFQMQLGGLDAQITDLTTALKKLEGQSDAFKKTMSQTAEVDKFVAGDLTWLEELRELSAEFPPPDKAQVSDFQALAQANGGGRMIVSGMADSSKTISELEQTLRDDRHGVAGAGTGFNTKAGKLPWKFQETLTPAAESRAIPDAPAQSADEKEESAKPQATANVENSKKSSARSSGSRESRKGGRP